MGPWHCLLGPFSLLGERPDARVGSRRRHRARGHCDRRSVPAQPPMIGSAVEPSQSSPSSATAAAATPDPPPPAVPPRRPPAPAARSPCDGQPQPGEPTRDRPKRPRYPPPPRLQRTKPKTWMNWVAFGCGLGGLFTCGVSSIAAIVFGHLGLAAAKRGEADQSGRGHSRGWCLGYVFASHSSCALHRADHRHLELPRESRVTREGTTMTTPDETPCSGTGRCTPTVDAAEPHRGGSRAPPAAPRPRASGGGCPARHAPCRLRGPPASAGVRGTQRARPTPG